MSDRGQCEPARDLPMFLQLYWRYRNAIAQGGLRPGDRVPSVRSLASDVGVARGAVEKAYELLVSEGYLLTRGPAGTVVSPMAGSVGAGRRQRHPPPRAAPSLDTSSAGVLSRPFQLGVPAFDAFPSKVWKRLAGRHLRSLEMAAMAYPEAAGYEPLRRAIANYLVSSRGVACTYEQVFVTAGYPGALDLICRTLLKTGDVGWYEDPGYLFARQFLQRSGMQLQPVSVDEEGLNVGEGLKQNPAARFAVVTPAHQSPTGVALSLPRRLQLLDWASQANGWVIEDDYDSEFRYHGRPLPALGSLDDNDRVLYTGSFSKVLFPGLRLAYLVVPKAQTERFTDAAGQLGGVGSFVSQATVAEFMEQGHFSRHLRRMRALYSQRRSYLVDALTDIFGPRMAIQPQAGGLQVLAYPSTGQSDALLAQAAQAHGLPLQALSRWRIRPSSSGGLLMGFSGFATREHAYASVQRLRAALDDVWAPAGHRVRAASPRA